MQPRKVSFNVMDKHLPEKRNRLTFESVPNEQIVFIDLNYSFHEFDDIALISFKLTKIDYSIGSIPYNMSDTVVQCFIENEIQNTIFQPTLYSRNKPIGDMFYFDVIITVPNSTNQNILACKCPFPYIGHRCQHRKAFINTARNTYTNIENKDFCVSGWSGKECKQKECFEGFCLHGGNY
ncbi:hypothetical protein RF11_15186 [Thelohanellus kitauei]|uniref:Uncharacterized protein n=1 Tax=Thelohanellus kitauei TaxID=669202 RepID=A0A0C2NFA1_THEKT|nr:hypothetical protein RF11_15186 [Thelohanellus kitauei]